LAIKTSIGLPVPEETQVVEIDPASEWGAGQNLEKSRREANEPSHRTLKEEPTAGGQLFRSEAERGQEAYLKASLLSTTTFVVSVLAERQRRGGEVLNSYLCGDPDRTHSGHGITLVLLTLVLSGLSGCAMRMGPKTIPRDRFDYSGAINRSWKEQMLLNLVRVRYLDPPMFLDVQQVVAQYSFERSGSINSPDWEGNPVVGLPAVGVSGKWVESPTITFNPMSGEKFTTSLLQPIQPVDLFALVQAGWPIDGVFGVGVRAINGLHAGSRTELLKRSADPDFYQVLTMLKDLQATDSFGLRVQEKDAGPGKIVVFRAQQVDEAANATDRQVRHLLHLNPDAQEFKLTLGAAAADDKEIAMLTRSMLEILAEASAGIDIPASDVEEGRVVKMSLPDASSGTGPKLMVRVHSASAKPPANNAFAAVKYRDHWFWVDDRDLVSKRGMGFLLVLFTLVESGSSATPPVLTISKP
jgi:hypothetical protein